MIHLGDITKINGAEAPEVNVIIGGSPCQDLSVAGQRKGLKGERSGLFMEQIRIIKEMRSKSERSGATDIKPRYMVWENVPGAFSSNKGQDFKAVLEEVVKAVKKDCADIPIPEGGWHYSGCIVGDGFSVAWRVFDAQFWGVPQRRRRIALVADFGGTTAPEILFERESVSGDITQSGTPWEVFAAAIAKRFEIADRARGRNENEVVCCLNCGEVAHTLISGIAKQRGTTQDNNIICIQGNCIDRADNAGCNGKGWREDKSYTLNTVDRPAVAVFENHGQDSRFNGPVDVSQTVSATFGMGGNNTPFVVNDKPAVGFKYKARSKSGSVGYEKEKAGTLNRMHDQQAIITLDRAAFNQGENAQYDFKVDDEGVNSTIVSKGPSAVCSQSTVRRLTPLECERLQGFPDGWTDIGEYIDTNGKKRKTSDSARYKALGNSIALPSWVWVLERISNYCGTDKTMASLFDGIGGFPLIWKTLNGKDTCLWASEIEEFPIAVTKYHFGKGE